MRNAATIEEKREVMRLLRYLIGGGVGRLITRIVRGVPWGRGVYVCFGTVRRIGLGVGLGLMTGGFVLPGDRFVTGDLVDLGVAFGLALERGVGLGVGVGRGVGLAFGGAVGVGLGFGGALGVGVGRGVGVGDG